MKIVAIFALASVLACGQTENYSEASFVITKKAPAKEYYYAKYEFSHDDYEDVVVVVRIEVSNAAPKEMAVKDLTPQESHRPVETLMLDASGDVFVGRSTGDVGGEYRVSLENTVCCGQIVFIPDVKPSISFIGVKIEDLTAKQWAEFTAPATGLSPSALGTKQVGKIFTVVANDRDYKGARVELRAYGSDGVEIEQGLAHWTKVGGYVYDTTIDLVDGHGKLDMFLTAQGQDVRKIASFIGTNKRGEASIAASAYTGGNVWVSGDRSLVFSYYHTGWEDNGIEVMIVNANGKVVKEGTFAMGDIYPFIIETYPPIEKFYGNILENSEALLCPTGHKAFVRIPGEDRVKQTNCVPI